MWAGRFYKFISTSGRRMTKTTPRAEWVINDRRVEAVAR